MKRSKCIYCLTVKPISDFNREHVISRFMGTYENAYVLGKGQVCKDCNSYFCDNIENVVSFDSLEGLLRTEHLHKSMKSKRAISKTRLKISGGNDIFNGLSFYISSNPMSPNHIQMEIVPTVGIILDPSKNLYEYFPLESLPACDDAIRKRIASSKTPFVCFGYDDAVVSAKLQNLGYELSNAKYTGNLDLSDLTAEQSIDTKINVKVDSLLTRLALKNLLNFICYAYGQQYILGSEFDNLRTFARYGTINTPLKMFISDGGIKYIPGECNNCHSIGLAWSVIGTQIYLCGFVSWFNQISYVFAIKPVKTGLVNYLPPEKFIICDNDNRIITEDEKIIVFDWPGDNKKMGFLDNYL